MYRRTTVKFTSHEPFISYILLGKSMFDQAFHDIDCYLNGHGRIDEKEEGKLWLDWIVEKQGNFSEMSLCFGTTIKMVHELCMRKINEIKNERPGVYNSGK